MAMQFVLTMLIIDHITAVHQCLDACNEILGVLAWPGYNLFELSKMHMGVDVMCHSLLDSVEEGRSFCLGHFLFLFAANWHPLCMHFQGFGSQGCKNISEVVLTIWQDAVEEEPVLQGMAKYGEGVIGILGIPVIDGQVDGCHPSCQCTSNGIGCGLGRLGDQLLWSWFWGYVSCAGWSDNGQIRKKQGEDTKVLISQEPLVQFTSNLDSVWVRVCPTIRWHCFYGDDIMGCIQVCKVHTRCFSGLKKH